MTKIKVTLDEILSGLNKCGWEYSGEAGQASVIATWEKMFGKEKSATVYIRGMKDGYAMGSSKKDGFFNFFIPIASSILEKDER